MHRNCFSKLKIKSLNLLFIFLLTFLSVCYGDTNTFAFSHKKSFEVIPDLQYANAGNPRHTLDLFIPTKNTITGAHSSKSPMELPLVIWIHGGAWQNGSKISGKLPARLPKILQTGRYIGASINYRLSGESTWPAQIHDCKAAIRWLRAHSSKYGINKKKIAVWGASAGGHLVGMLGTTNGVKEFEGTVGKFLEDSSKVQAIINYYGPSAFLQMDDHPSKINHRSPSSPESKLLGKPIDQVPDLSKQASPFHHVKENLPPFIHFHGTKDPLVPFHQSLILHEAMLKQKNESCLITVRGGSHSMPPDFTDQFVIPFLDFHFYSLGSRIHSQEIIQKR